MAWQDKTPNPQTRGAPWRRARKQAKQQLPEQCQSAEAHVHCQGPLELDHKTPIHKGGTNSLDNLQWLCRYHHKQKTQEEAKSARALRLSRAVYPKQAAPGLKAGGPSKEGSFN